MLHLHRHARQQARDRPGILSSQLASLLAGTHLQDLDVLRRTGSWGMKPSRAWLAALTGALRDAPGWWASA